MLLADWGLAARFVPGQLVSFARGSLAYAMPELRLREPYDAPTADYWSLGVVLYTLLHGHLPFRGPSRLELDASLRRGPKVNTTTLTPPCQDLVARLLCYQRSKRLLALDDIEAHPWCLSKPN